MQTPRVSQRPLLVLLGRPVLLLLVLLGWLEARMGVAAGSNGNNLPLLVLHLQVLALRVERAVNQMVESSKRRLSSAYWM